MSSTHLSQAEAERLVRSWGFANVFTWTDRPNAHYPPHTHAGLTTHLVLSGKLTLTYPGEEKSRKHVCGPGARFDVKAHQKHEVWIGSSGCTYVIGE